jgi:hypothetical protein
MRVAPPLQRDTPTYRGPPAGSLKLRSGPEASGTAESVLAFLGFFIFYWFLRLPTREYAMGYLDDGETLYHAFALLKGQIPYRDDVTHHFLGYILPVALAGQILGFSDQLIRVVALWNQPLMALGVYAIIRLFTPARFAFLGGLLALSAREPAVLGFPVQYQSNLLLVWIAYTALRYLRDGPPCMLLFCAVLTGIGITFDQRNFLFPCWPLVAVLLRLRKPDRPQPATLFIAALLALLPTTIMLTFLWQKGAIADFWFQTWQYPRQFRIGSLSLMDLISNGVYIHHYLLSRTGELLFIALVGCCMGSATLLRRRFEAGGLSSVALAQEEASLSLIVLVLLAVCTTLPIPFLSGRDYDYYTIPWLPWLAIIATLGIYFLQPKTTIGRTIQMLLICLPLISPLVATVENIPATGYRGDGIREVVAQIKPQLTPKDTVLVLGYRMQLYVELEKLAHNRFVNQLMIFPDSIVSGAKRDTHIVKAYEAQFIHGLLAAPPTFVIHYRRIGKEEEPGPGAPKFLRELLSTHYDPPLIISGTDPGAHAVEYRIYRLAEDGNTPSRNLPIS